MNTHIHRLAAAAALCLLATTAAHAQATIDQTKALAGNVTPGDAAGFPIVISQPGSYKLTSNLYVPAGLPGISITADNVTLDLNGFMVLGTNTCKQDSSTYAVSCTQSDLKNGIETSGKSAVVKNGSVRGFSGSCILPYRSARLESLMVEECKNGVVQWTNSGDVVHIINTEVKLSGTGLNLYTGFIADSSVAASTVGIDGSPEVSIHNSHVRRNALGIQNGVLRGVVVEGNKTQMQDGIISLGGNLKGSTPF